jgi:hypothetical protein
MLGRCKSSEMPRFLFGKTADTNDSKKTGLLGRFRKKKNIIQDEIKIGSILPDIDVGVVSIRKGNNDNVISIALKYIYLDLKMHYQNYKI